MLSSVPHGGTKRGDRQALPLLCHTDPRDGLGELQPMLSASYQGCLLTMYCLEWQYSTYSFATTSLWVLPTSLALAQLCEQRDMSQIEEIACL